jgi:predicted transposase YdaD
VLTKQVRGAIILEDRQRTVRQTEEQKQIFDAAFKRLMRLSSSTIIQFLNGLFDLDLPLNSKVTYPNTEQILPDLGKQYADVIIIVHTEHGEHSFLLEEQTENDGTMLIRVFSYGYQFALEHKVTEGNITTVKLPRAMVIYLNPNSKTPYRETLRIETADGQTLDYAVGSLRLLDYSAAELAERNMELLLPFRLLKLRSKIDGAKSSERRVVLAGQLKQLVGEVLPLIERSEANGKLTARDTETILTILDRLNDYLYTSKYEEFQEVDKMVQEILYTRFDRARDEARREGRQEGIGIGVEKGRQEGVSIGADKTADTMFDYLRSKGIDPKLLHEAQQFAKKQTLIELSQ